MPPGLTGTSAGSLLLEEPLIRTPYELLRREHRSAQRQVEKDFKGVQSVLNGLLKSFDDKPMSQEKRATVNAKLDLGIDKVRGLKRKLDDLQPSESKPSFLKARLRYLDSIIASGATDRQAPVEIKIEPPEESSGPTLPIDIKVDTQTTVTSEATGDEVKTEVKEDVEMPMSADAERASSPLAPYVSQDDPADVSEPVHEDKNIARYLVDYLFRKGYMKTAQAVTDGSNIEQLVDVKLFAELHRIGQALVDNHSVTEALAWCGENRGTLKKTKNNLEFTLRMQEFVELCRQRKVPEAIVYSRKNLAPWAATHLVELQQAMTLLAFGEKSGVAVYRRLYDPSRWLDVRDQFRKTFLSLYGLPSQPLLCLSSFAGLASLRLPSCARHQSSHPVPLRPAAPPLNDMSIGDLIDMSSPADSIASQSGSTEPLDIRTGNVDCPSCDPNLRVLTHGIPMSHHVNSTLVCRISGEVMDSENEPLAFPNGNVYSSKALREMAKRSFEVVTCPRTKESCAFSKLRKVYIS